MKEPSLEDMDDYNGHESKSKRKTINYIIIGLLIVGVIFGIIKTQYNSVNDYVGTPQKPGINTSKSY